jgi:hypothetical protein
MVLADFGRKTAFWAGCRPVAAAAEARNTATVRQNSKTAQKASLNRAVSFLSRAIFRTHRSTYVEVYEAAGLRADDSPQRRMSTDAKTDTRRSTMTGAPTAGDCESAAPATALNTAPLSGYSLPLNDLGKDAISYQEVVRMTVTPLPDQVQALVLQAFEELGVKPNAPSDVNETILIQDGHYFARTYRLARLMAMWFVDNGFIQFYDADGNMLRTINLGQETSSRRMAA